MGLRALILCLVLLPGLAFARCEGFVPGPRPQNTAREFIGATLDEIVERGWIEFAVYDAFPPYSYQDGATPKGIDIEVGRLIAANLGVEPRFNFVLAGENLDADLLYNIWKGGAVDNHVSNVMMRVPYNSEYGCRHDQVTFTGQYAGEKIAIAYAKAAYPDAVQVPDADGRHPDAPVPAFFRYDSVAVENDSIADFYLTSLPGGGLADKIHRYPSMQSAMEALRSGQVMAAMGPLSQLKAGADATIAVHTPPMPGFAAGRWTLGVAVSQQHRDLGYAIDDAIAAGLADGRIARIYADYGAEFIAPER